MKWWADWIQIFCNSDLSIAFLLRFRGKIGRLRLDRRQNTKPLMRAFAIVETDILETGMEQLVAEYDKTKRNPIEWKR